jgi:hypothetical protein
MHNFLETQPNKPDDRAPSRQTSLFYRPFFLVYCIFTVYFYFTVIQPYLASGDVYGPRLLADSITYEAICTIERDFLDLATLRDIGPCLGLWIFSYNSGLLSFVNAGLIVLSVIWLAKTYGRSWEPMLALVLINPITFCSIFGANKEVFALTSFAMLAIFIRSRSLPALCICLITALFTRLPAFATTISYCMLLVTLLPRTGKISAQVTQRYWFIIAGMAIFTTLVSVVYGEALQLNLLGDFSTAEDVSRSTEFSLSLNNLSSAGLYIAVYVVRLILNFYSGAMGFTNLLQGEGANYYTVAVAGSSTIFILLSGLLIYRGLPDDLSKTADFWNILLFIVFVTVLLCLSPVIQHRYFFGIYIILVLFTFSRKDESNA